MFVNCVCVRETVFVNVCEMRRLVSVECMCEYVSVVSE